MSTTANAIFTGTSRFSTDFQQVITRAVSIASLPLTQLNNQKTALGDQATALSSLDNKYSALQSTLTSLQTATGWNSLSSSVSDGSIARVNIASGASPGVFTLEVTDLGSYTNMLSGSSFTRVSDPSVSSLSTSPNFTLTVNGTDFNISPKANTLQSLVEAINNTTGSGVQASLVNVGPNSSPDYRLNITSTKLGPVSVQLNDGTTDILDTLNTGTLGSYKINGLSTPISTDSRTVTLAPGVTANLLGKSSSGAAATLTVSQQNSNVSNALSSFVSAFNSTVDELATHRGKAGGALSGQSLVAQLSNGLSKLGSYSNGSGSIRSLADLGITFDTSGHLNFDQATFNSVATGQLSSITAFLGSATGGGFLQSATNLISSVEDPTKGLLQNTLNTVDTQITHQQDLIDRNQARIDQLKTDLQKQLAKSDALVASLEQSYTVLTGIFKAQTTDQNNS